jgi:hypothetical protein
MGRRDAVPGDERTQLENCLKELARGRGIWRDDLIDLFQGDLSALQRRWNVNLRSGIEVARIGISAILDDYINTLYPRRWNRQLIDKDEVGRYRLIVQITFNTFRASHLSNMNLQERREWLVKTYGARIGVSEKTSRRLFDQAVGQLTQLLISGAQTPNVDDLSAIDMAPDAFPPGTPHADSGAGTAEPMPDIAAASSGLVQPAPPRQSLIAHLLVLSGEVRQTMEAARNTCRLRNRRFHTSDTLLALLDMPSGRVRDCFNCDATVEWAHRVRQKLVAPPISDKEPFVEFEWVECDEFRLALQYASSDGAPVVSEFHLLLAILNGSSETNRWLKRFLQQDYAKVRAAADRGRGDGPKRIKTPMWD